MVTLFDPVDLSHHEADPEDWYCYDFAFANDLDTGRFVAVITDTLGSFNVRLTTGPLTEEEHIAAGPPATQRLRVIDHRLLLAGGDAWPSTAQGARALAHDPRWISIDNGDYQVIITALDRKQGARQDLMIQFISVEDIKSVAYAPGVPYLVVGEAHGVVGISAGGKHYRESCAGLPSSAVWSPPTSLSVPVPGSMTTIDLSARLHARGRALQASSSNAAIPIVIARNPDADSVGFFIRPENWPSHAAAANGELPIRTRILCAVRILGVVPDTDRFMLQVEALPAALDMIPRPELHELTASFENWVRTTSDPAWRYRSAQIQRTRDQRSVILGIMEYLTLTAQHGESLLQEDNATLAVLLPDHMSQPNGARDQ
jgi:hypothetical protein